MDPILPAAVGVLMGYVMGSISFALLVGYLIRGIDLRTVGSGNLGATNVARSLGRPLGILVYGLDFGKGLVSVVFLPGLAEYWLPPEGGVADLGLYCGVAAIAGHMFPFYLRFRGGKGVATASGVFVALVPVPTIIAAAVWGIAALATRYVAVASMAAAAALPVAFLALEPGRALGNGLRILLFSILIVALVVLRHRSNIRRLLAGTENRIGVAGSGVSGERQDG